MNLLKKSVTHFVYDRERRSTLEGPSPRRNGTPGTVIKEFEEEEKDTWRLLPLPHPAHHLSFDRLGKYCAICMSSKIAGRPTMQVELWDTSSGGAMFPMSSLIVPEIAYKDVKVAQNLLNPIIRLAVRIMPPNEINTHLYH
jgi:hypothetical protein